MIYDDCRVVNKLIISPSHREAKAQFPVFLCAFTFKSVVEADLSQHLSPIGRIYPLQHVYLAGRAFAEVMITNDAAKGADFADDLLTSLVTRCRV